MAGAFRTLHIVGALAPCDGPLEMSAVKRLVLAFAGGAAAMLLMEAAARIGVWQPRAQIVRGHGLHVEDGTRLWGPDEHVTNLHRDASRSAPIRSRQAGVASFAAERGARVVWLAQALADEDHLALRLNPICHYNAHGLRRIAPIVAKALADPLPRLRVDSESRELSYLRDSGSFGPARHRTCEWVLDY